MPSTKAVPTAPVPVIFTQESTRVTDDTPRIVKSTRIDAGALTGNFILSRVSATAKGVKDPVVELFVSVRNRYKKELHIAILPARRTEDGWQYTLIPANIEDGDTNIVAKFEQYLEWHIAPDFEERLELFFSSENGYQRYQQYLQEGDIKGANKVVEDFIYALSTRKERKHLDEKRKKEEERQAVVEANKRSLQQKLGISGSLLGLLATTILF